MLYACRNCGRSFECGEAISFCPFCGEAYDCVQKQNTMRVVIGSDSERTIQEKYWRMVRDDLEMLFLLLREPLIKHKKDYEPQSLNLHAWMQKQKKSASISGFFHNCDRYLDRLKAALNREMEIAEPFDMDAFQQQADEACIEFAELLGSTFPKRLCPEMDYDAEDMDDIDDEDDSGESRRLDPIYCQLWEAVDSSKAKLYEVARENSLYAVFSCEDALFSDKEIQKGLAQFIDELRTESHKRFDFLFDDDYEEFVLLFWQAVKILTDEINRVFVLEKIDKGEEMRLEASDDYLEHWQSALERQLDQVYQEQSMNMMDVYREVEEQIQRVEEMHRFEEA